MVYDLDYYENLPSRGKVNWWHALIREGNNSGYGSDWDLTNQASNHRRNIRAKNAKAKHRWKYYHRRHRQKKFHQD